MRCVAALNQRWARRARRFSVPLLFKFRYVKDALRGPDYLLSPVTATARLRREPDCTAESRLCRESEGRRVCDFT